MGTTTRGYPYPEGSDPPDGATQMQALAEAVDTDAAALDGRVTAIEADKSVQSGTVTLIFSNQNLQNSDLIPFSPAYAAPPQVAATASDGFINVSIGQKTASEMRVYGRHVNNTGYTATIDVDWVAVGTLA